MSCEQEWMAEYRTKRAAEDADFRASEEAKAAVEAQKDKVGRRAAGFQAVSMWWLDTTTHVHHHHRYVPYRVNPVQVRELDRVHREARSASRSAEKLLLDPPPTEKLVLHVSLGRWLPPFCLLCFLCSNFAAHSSCAPFSTTLFFQPPLLS